MATCHHRGYYKGCGGLVVFVSDRSSSNLADIAMNFIIYLPSVEINGKNKMKNSYITLGSKDGNILQMGTTCK